jgi:hypothetical protein
LHFFFDTREKLTIREFYERKIRIKKKRKVLKKVSLARQRFKLDPNGEATTSEQCSDQYA